MGFIYASIRVRDVKKSLAFYAKRLGMKEVERKSYMPGETVVTLVSEDTGQQLRLMHYAESCRLYKPYEKGDELDHLTFRAKDAGRLYRKLVASGAPVAMPLWEDKNVTLGYVKDPDGIWIGLITPKNK